MVGSAASVATASTSPTLAAELELELETDVVEPVELELENGTYQADSPVPSMTVAVALGLLASKLPGVFVLPASVIGGSGNGGCRCRLPRRREVLGWVGEMPGQRPYTQRDPVARRGSGEVGELDNRGVNGVQRCARDLGDGGSIEGDTGDHGPSDGAGDGGRSAPPNGQGNGSVGIRRRPPGERKPLLLPPRFDHRDRHDGEPPPTGCDLGDTGDSRLSFDDRV